MSVRRLFPSSNSKYIKDYFEAVEHYNKDRFPETVEAAKYNLTDETLPPALQIKNHILISAATDNQDEARDARQAAERIWEYVKGRIPAGPEYEYERECLEGLRAAIDELDIEEEEESDMEDEDVDMDEDEFEEEEEEEEGELERSVPVKGGMKGGIEGKSEAADDAFEPVKVESDTDMKHEADIKQEPEYEAGGSGGSSSHLEDTKSATLPIRRSV